MWVIDRNENDLLVGYWINGKFRIQYIFSSDKELEVMALVNYLNGGDGNILDKERWNDLKNV